MGMNDIGNQYWQGLGERIYRFCKHVASDLAPTCRIPVVLVVYTLGLTGSLWLAYQLRFDFAVPLQDHHEMLRTLLWSIPTKLALLLMIGQVEGLLSYFSIPDLRRLTLALVLGSLVLALVWAATQGSFAPPRSVIICDCLLSILILGAIRVFLRRAREVYLHTPQPRDARISRIGIMGAGDAGAALARDLLLKQHGGLRPIVFFDDDEKKWNRRLHDLPVVGPPEIMLDNPRKWNLDKIVIAIPSAPARRVREIVAIFQKAGIKFETVPSMEQLASGYVKVSQIRPVEIEDLLGREPVQLETENIRRVLEGKTIMVTGAGGSIGSELCRQIASYNPRTLLLVERSEVQLFPIEQQLIRLGYSGMVVALIADILDSDRMQTIFEQYQPQAVFHAAAHKHVPMMEAHPCEAIRNNSLGTAGLASWALDFGVERFVMISTDKAINPTSVMGASKRLAEIFVQSLWASQSGKVKPLGQNGAPQTKFMAVRFGNVLGSSGSVIPTFKEQIAAGGPVTVTHPEVTRYFMTIPEAVGLVLQSAAQGNGGEIFVLDMGKPVRIVNLARQLIELSGLVPGEDIDIKFIGLRPGEKLFEELSHRSENLMPTNHPKILRFLSRPVPLKVVQEHLTKLSHQLHISAAPELKEALRALVPEYTPCLDNGNLEDAGSVEEKSAGGNGKQAGKLPSVANPTTGPLAGYR